MALVACEAPHELAGTREFIYLNLVAALDSDPRPTDQGPDANEYTFWSGGCRGLLARMWKRGSLI